MTSKGRCDDCGKTALLTRHHVKPAGAVNGPTRLRLRDSQGYYIHKRLCIACHQRIHGITKKRVRNVTRDELSRRMKDGKTVEEFRILRGFRLLEAEKERKAPREPDGFCLRCGRVVKKGLWFCAFCFAAIQGASGR